MRTKRNIIWYNPVLSEKARKLRNESTKSEIILWKYLKGKQMLGYDFHRQKPLNNYIVDFFCNELMLAIEIDGSSHDSNERQEEDNERQEILEELGIRFLRFRDEEVKMNTEKVLDEIRNWVVGNNKYYPIIEEHTPAPLERG
ncbi:MAG: endonuclease domain-containing protein [bacterium]